MRKNAGIIFILALIILGSLVVINRGDWNIFKSDDSETSTEQSEESSDEKEADDGYTGHTYEFIKHDEVGLPKDFDAWEAYCEKLGGHLAIINCEEENQIIFNQMKEHDLSGCFFGLTDYGHDGDWRWVDGTPLTYDNWEPGQPNKGENSGGVIEHYGQFYKTKVNGEYVETTTGTWNNAKIASNSFYFICEFDN